MVVYTSDLSRSLDLLDNVSRSSGSSPNNERIWSNDFPTMHAIIKISNYTMNFISLRHEPIRRHTCDFLQAIVTSKTSNKVVSYCFFELRNITLFCEPDRCFKVCLIKN
jgi:hypothetical protein